MSKLSNSKCLDIKEYVRKRKLSFRPDLVMLLLYKRDQILPMCVQQKAKKYLVPVKDSIHCQRKKEKITHNIIAFKSKRNIMQKTCCSI